MPREINPRRRVLPLLQTMRRTLTALTATWTVRTVFDEETRRMRSMTDEEKPENQPVAWTNLANEMDELARLATGLAAWARHQARGGRPD